MSSTVYWTFAVLLIAAFVVSDAQTAKNPISDEIDSARSGRSSATAVIQRKKRYLDFIPLTRMFVIFAHII